jgi:hypothetical protein
MARGPRATTTRGDARESICIAWFRASHPDGAAVHSTPGNPTGHRGRTPPRPARRLRQRGRLTRATTDLHRQAPSARAASGALTLLRPSRPLRAGSPSGPSPHNAALPPSLSFRRAELRPPDCGRERLASFVGTENARNGSDQRLAILSEPHLPILSRVRCIALFRI